MEKWRNMLWIHCHVVLGRRSCGGNPEKQRLMYTLAQRFPDGSVAKNLPAMRVMSVQSLGTIPYRRKWQPTPVFLPGKSHGQRSLVSYTGVARVWHTLVIKPPPLYNNIQFTPPTPDQSELYPTSRATFTYISLKLSKEACIYCLSNIHPLSLLGSGQCKLKMLPRNPQGYKLFNKNNKQYLS